MTLSIMCVSRVEPFAVAFLQALSDLAERLGAEFVLGVDGPDGFAAVQELPLIATIVPVKSAGYIESVHDHVLGCCRGDYVLRLDDDEQASDAMVRWLAAGEYRAEPLWKFARAHLWGWLDRYIRNAPLWPDEQTRLGRREMMGGRNTIHCGSPYGGGQVAPCVIEHHKFLVKSYEERRAIVARYDAISPGAGESFKAFSLPEELDGLVTAPFTDGAYANEPEGA